MPLPLPTLDDRTYQQLLEEVRERLPATAPDWTDYNVSDPGITLLELFAYLHESLLYRLDRVPASHHRAFLRLLGCTPRPARVAHTVVAFGTEAPVELPVGVQVANVDGDVVFQTGTRIHVTGAKLTAVIVSTGGKLQDHTAANKRLDEPFLALGADPQPGDALYLGFDKPLDEGSRISLFVIGEDAAADFRTWQALREEWRREATRFRDSCPRRQSGAACFWQHYGARMAWEYFSTASGSATVPGSTEEWKPLSYVKTAGAKHRRVVDCTRALSLSGPVRWSSPKPDDHRSGGVDGYDGTHFVRCRLVEGAYDCPPRIRGVLVNAVIARHAADVAAPYSLAPSTGHAAQRFRLPRAPVVPGSTRLEVTVSEALQGGWVEQRNFDRSGPHAKHYTVDAATGEIAFGDGRAGCVPDTRATLRVVNWKIGGGATGNVPSRTLTKMPADGPNVRIPHWDAVRIALAVCQPIAASGGADAEPIEAAKARAYRTIVEDRCATTLAELERLALGIPNVPIARAHAVAEFHPDLHCVTAAGCVTVVIVPRCTKRDPRPTDAMCRTVERYLFQRRRLAQEIHVTGPRHTVVTVSARLALANGADRKSVISQACAAVRDFLDPLSGGPEKNGWTIGRSVYRSEILALLDGVAGVQYVAELSLTANQGAAAYCGDIAICPHGLVTSGDHRITAV